MQAVVSIGEKAQPGLRRLPPHQTAPRQLLQIDGHHSTRAVLLRVVLGALHSHGEHWVEAAAPVVAAQSGLRPLRPLEAAGSRSAGGHMAFKVLATARHTGPRGFSNFSSFPPDITQSHI